MNILFICGSIEPGRDGVGDYTRLMAGQLILEGHKTAIVAIKDRNIDEVYTGYQFELKNQIEVTRIPSGISDNVRYSLLKKIILEFSPEIISLQYVPFAFDLKGLPFFFGTKLKSISTGNKWHIMFHELWVGMDKESSIKHTYWGALQKMLINSLIRKLNPVFIHTQTQVYKAQLIAMGYKPELLPLFSNIKRDGKLTGTKSSGDVLKIIVFGIIQERCFIKEFANDAAEYSIKNKRPISLLFAGRLGARIVEWKSVIETSGLTVEIIGEQTAETISMLLSGADFGLSSTPLAQMEKSGAFAAMREHDLPVICIARQWTPRNVRFEPPHGVFNYPAMSFADIITGGITFQSKKQPAGNGLSAVTRLFVNSVHPESELHT